MPNRKINGVTIGGFTIKQFRYPVNAKLIIITAEHNFRFLLTWFVTFNERILDMQQI